MESNVILKTKAGKQLYFFYDDGLCFREIGPFDPSQKRIYADCTGQFDVLELECGKLVILCEDRKGGIVFLAEDEGDWLKTTLLQSKSGQSGRKNFSLFEVNGWLNGFYCLSYQEQVLLVHHIIDNEDVQPEVVDLLHGEDFNVFQMENGDFLTVYHSDYSNGNLGFKSYAWNRKEWSRFETIDKGEMLSAVKDGEDNLYVVYRQEEACYLKILKKDAYQTAFSQQRVPLSFLNGVIKKVRLVIENGKLWILYHNGASMFAAYCTVGAYTFSAPQQFVSRGECKDFYFKTGNSVRRSYGYLNHNIPELLILKDVDKREETGGSSEIERFAGLQRTTDTLDRAEIENRKNELELSSLRRDIELIKKRLTSIEKSVVYKENR